MKSYGERIAQAKESLKMTDFPSQVVVESTAFCDFKCPACPSPILERARGFIEPQLFRKIIDEIAQENPGTELWFAFMGEALLWKGLFSIIRYAKDKGLRKTYLNTNGNILTPRLHQSIYESGLDRIIISIDGHSKKTFNAIRLGGEYERVKDHTLALLKTARNNNWAYPEIWVQMIVMDQNQHEEEAVRKFWLEAGAVVKIRPRLSWGERVEAPNLKRLDIARDFPCPWIMRQMVVAWDGQILMCGSDHEAKYPVGNIQEISLREAWNGALKKRREMHQRNDFRFPLCVECNDWKVGISELYRGDRPREEVFEP